MQIVNTKAKKIGRPTKVRGFPPPVTDYVEFYDPYLKLTQTLDTKVEPCKIGPGDAIELVRDGRTFLGIGAVACIKICEFSQKPPEEGGCALFSRR